MPAPFLLDCDTGIDDAMGILYLLSDPAAEPLAITTTYGNVGVELTAANTLALLELAGRTDIPVSAGAEHPLHRPFDGGAPYVHGANGIGNVVLPVAKKTVQDEFAPDTIVRLAGENPGRLNIVATGPLTNIALALEAEPNLPALVDTITVMGGTTSAPGNISPVAEANIGNDPEAAAAVFAAPWNITMVGLDVTMGQRFTVADQQTLLAAESVVAQTVGQMLDCYFNFYETVLGYRACALHDPLTVAVATGSVALKMAPKVRVTVDASNGPGRGQTVADLRGMYRGYPDQDGAHCRVALELVEPFEPKLLSRLLSF